MYPTVKVCAQEGETFDNFNGFRGREAGVISGGNREEDELGIEVDNPFGGANRPLQAASRCLTSAQLSVIVMPVLLITQQSLPLLPLSSARFP